VAVGEELKNEEEMSTNSTMDPTFIDKEIIKQDLMMEKHGRRVSRKKYIIYPGDKFKNFWDIIMTM
jgi:hypothetical protein